VPEEEYGVSELERVQISHLRQFVQHLLTSKAYAHHPGRPTQDQAPSTLAVRGYVRAIKVLFHWCVDEELLTVDPSARLAQPKAPAFLIHTFTPAHFEVLLAVCDQKTKLGFRNYVLLLVLLDTGMRISELCGLRLSDVHDHFVRVLGKGRKEREIGLHPEVGRLLWKYINRYRKPLNPEEVNVFLGRDGTALQVSGAQEVLKDIKRKSGLEDVRVSAHTFRHTFARMYLERGGEVFKLSREMGHSTVQVTETYLKEFLSTVARREHTDFSPTGQLNLHLKKKRRRSQEDKH
jgi:integrase/recombinase XerD